MEPKLCRIVLRPFGGVDSANIEFPVAWIDRSHDWNAVADLPTEALRSFRADYRAFAISHERGPLVVVNVKLRIHVPIGFLVNREKRNEVFRVLINTAEPIRER